MSAPKPTVSRAPRNRTIDLTAAEVTEYKRLLSQTYDPNIPSQLIHSDAFSTLKTLKSSEFDLLFADPPYNLTKSFGDTRFVERSLDEYELWLDSWLHLCVPLLKPTASVYVCGDWRSSAAIQRVGSKYFTPRNRITWEREKGRGAKANWKNAAEDIWFFTVSDKFTFNLDAVKIKRRVIAPYTTNGIPKDWDRSEDGNFRTTHPSNIWTDISVPFWSMPENTDHPTQKPEKLLAKILLASTNKNDMVLDPFGGSGTTAIVAQKLDRRCIAIESDERYCLIGLKRLSLAKQDRSIQGFADGVFWERNSSPGNNKSKSDK